MIPMHICIGHVVPKWLTEIEVVDYVCILPTTSTMFVESLGLSLGLVNDTKCNSEVNVSLTNIIF